jgi:hypothetical protein
VNGNHQGDVRFGELQRMPSRRDLADPLKTEGERGDNKKAIAYMSLPTKGSTKQSRDSSTVYHINTSPINTSRIKKPSS